MWSLEKERRKKQAWVRCLAHIIGFIGFESPSREKIEGADDPSAFIARPHCADPSEVPAGLLIFIGEDMAAPGSPTVAARLFLWDNTAG